MKYPNYSDKGTDFFGYPIFLGATVITSCSGDRISIKYGKVLEAKDDRIFIKGGNTPKGVWRNCKDVIVYMCGREIEYE